MQVGGIVLCGGKSRRMGVSKATLPFGSETMLERTLRLLSEVVEPLVVVTAVGEPSPVPDRRVIATADRCPGRGPLEGLRAGLEALGDQAEAAYVSGCDVPLLQPALVRRLIELLGDHDVVVPVDARFHHPLSAVYRTRVRGAIERLLDQDRLRPVFLFDEVATRRIPVERLREVDADLDSLANLNGPDDYLAALERAGLRPCDEVLRQLQAARTL